jgi:hypothetical protein
MTKYQHAFIKQHSTLTNSLQCMQDGLLSLNFTSTLMLSILTFLERLTPWLFPSYCLNWNVMVYPRNYLNWISCFCTVVDAGCFSSLVSVVSAVPHVVVSGPLLFLLFVNNIESVSDGKPTLQLLVDDVKLYSSVDVHDHHNSLKLSLDRLSAWADQWQLTINIS